MEIESTRFRDVLLVKVIGRLDGESSSRFEWVCTEGIQAGAAHLVIDLQQMEYVSSMGLRGFLTAAKKPAPSGGRVSLCSLHGLPKQVFEITHLLPMFELFDSTEAALSSSGPQDTKWLTLNADITSLPEFSRFVRQGAAEADIAASELQKLELVLEELLLNVAHYGYPDGIGSIEVGYTVREPGRLRLEVCDSGKPFNPLEAPPPNLTENINERPDGGMGLLLVTSLGRKCAVSERPVSQRVVARVADFASRGSVEPV